MRAAPARPAATNGSRTLLVRVIRLAIVGVLAWAALVTAMVLLENRFIYFPWREYAAQPRDYGLDAEEVWLEAADGVRLHGWWIRGSGDRALVWYHGNAGNISHRLDNARLLVDRFGLDILLAGYRGYGRSEGRPDETGLYLDGFAMYEEAIRRGVAPKRVILFGRSLGAAVATHVAVAREAGAVILETPFLSIPAMAREVYPFVPRFVIRTRFDTSAKIGRIGAPLLILHGDRDEIVPLAHGRRLYELAGEPKRLFVIPGASHNDTYVAGGEAYWRAWRDFLDATGASQP